MSGISICAANAQAAITLVQHVSRDAGTATSTTLAFPANNTAGDWIAVCVRAGHANETITVQDSRGSVYKRAAQMNVTVDVPNGETLAVFYAENVAGGANTVTVSDTSSATLRVAILEYAGIAQTNSLDVAVAAQGTNASPNSGTATTTAGGDLVMGVMSTSDPATYSAGSSYAIEEHAPAEPNTKLIVEDRVQTSASSVSAAAILATADPWGAMLVAFRGAAVSNTSTPTISSLSPTSGTAGTSVTISGANFGSSQGTSTVKFNGMAATPKSWSAGSIVAPVPSGATSGNVVVTVNGTASNGMAFTMTPGAAASISSLSPTSGGVGTSVTISGANFGASQGTSTVKFNGTAATPTSWSATSIATAVPTGATSGNVVVTVGGVASNGVSFTVTTTAAPSISSVSPTSGAVGTSVTINGANFGASQGSSTVKFNGTAATPTSWGATSIAAAVPTGATSGNVVVTVGGVASNGVSFTVTTTSSSMGPLKQSMVNTRYWVTPSGNAVFLAGSHTWDDFQDTDTSGSTPAAFDFTSYVNFLKQHGQNATILWRKDLPEYCGWNFSGSVWRAGPWPWLRPGPGVATDSLPKFDLTQLDQTYFDRLRAHVQQLQQSGIYAIVQLFDGNQLTSARCSTDGYPFSGPNNINGVNDGYTSGASGTSSVTMTAANAISGYQDTYVKKVLDTLNDLPNVIYEVAEEQPAGSATWWFPHVISLVKSYEATKPLQHPAGIGAMNATAPNDGTLYASAADWIAPTINTNFSNQFPSNVSMNNQGKVVINDADHAYYWKTFTNSDGSLNNTQMRNYLWENLTSGAEGVVLMDPYVVYWTSSPNRNLCVNPSHQICRGGVDTKFDLFRSEMGYLQKFANSNLNLVRMTPQGGLASTGFCLADNSATGAEYVVYAPSGGTFTVNLSVTTRVMNVEWLNPSTGATTTGPTISGGSTQSFTAPFSGDAVLYLVDAAGHN